MAVIQITSREFREKQASMFALADKGEQGGIRRRGKDSFILTPVFLVIRRRGKVSYMLTPVYENDFILSPEFENRLEEGRRQYRARNVTVCTTKEELDKFLESL